MAKFQPLSFGKYLLLDKIATGGMAELYRAKLTGEQGFEKLVAIKKILPHLNKEQELITSFIDEAKLAALLQHQNIVQIHDFGSIEGTYFIAMEYLFGKDLRSITAKAKQRQLPLPLEYALYIISGVCAGLDYSHNLEDFQGTPLNIIHRDISPQNVLITHEGDIKIVDFGIAKAASKSTLTETGIIKGKVAYMSPEQAGGAIIDHRSDLFSTGILLYEMVADKRMFHGDTLQVLAKVRDAEFEPLDKDAIEAPEELHQILNRALAKEAADRYQSGAEMLADLNDCLAHFTKRPNTLGLSKYMKSLFADEITSETRLLREAARIVPGEEAAAGRAWGAFMGRLWAPLKEKAADILSKVGPSARQRPWLWIGAPAAAVLVAVLLLTALLHESPSTPADQSKPEKPALAATAATKGETGTTPSVEATVEQSAALQQAMQALENKQFAQAAQLFDKALAHEPSLEAKITPPYAQALRGQGTAIIATKPDEAKNLLQKAIELDPQNPEGHFEMGVLFVKMKDYPQAIKAYRKAAELDPRSPDTFFNLGFVYAVTKDYPNAETMFSRVVELKPRYLDEVYFNLAMVQYKQAKRQQSIENLEQALLANPKNQMARKYLNQFKSDSGEPK